MKTMADGTGKDEARPHSGKARRSSVKTSQAIRLLDRIISGDPWRQTAALVLAMVLAVVLGGFTVWYTCRCCGWDGQLTIGGKSCEGVGGGIWWALLHSIDTGFLEGEAGPDAAGLRPLAISLALFGWLVMNGLLIAVLVNWYERRGRNVRQGRVRYHLADGHQVILGWNSMGPSTVEALRRRGSARIAILSLADAEEVRQQIEAMRSATDCPSPPRTPDIFYGPFDAEAELRTLNIAAASRVVILGDAHVRGSDSRNLQTAIRIGHLRREMGLAERTPVSVYIADLRTHDIIQEVDVIDDVGNSIQLHPINFCEEWARRLWCVIPASNCAQAYAPLAHCDLDGIPGRRFVHLVVIGFGQMGQAVALQAARIAHYGTGRPTRITVVDCALTACRERFESHCGIGEIPDTEFDFVAASAESERVRSLLTGAAEDEAQVLTVAVCLSDPDAAMSTALSLPMAVRNGDIPILVRQETRSGLSTLADRIRARRMWKDMRFFGMLEDCLGLGERQDTIPRAIHAAYVAQARAEGWFKPDKPQFREWEDLPERYRWSNRYQADAFFERLRAFGYEPVPDAHGTPYHFPLVELEQMAEAEHDRWWAERLLAGWTLGDRNDDLLKHPNLVAYSQLSDTIREYDRDAIRNMPVLLREHLGLTLRRDGKGDRI